MRLRSTARTLEAEFLRAGPLRNQSLSPLVQYLGTVGDSSAAWMSVPFDQSHLERSLLDWAHEGWADSDTFGELAGRVGQLIAGVPGLPGALMPVGDEDLLLHLRVILSASELALIPFEAGAARAVPETSPARCQVSLTRSVRYRREGGRAWPSRARILFAAGPTDPARFAAHRDALLRGVAPFMLPPGRGPTDRPRDDRHTEHGDLVTTIRNASLMDLTIACQSRAYTHVHLLPGWLPDHAPMDPGLCLCEGAGVGVDVVSAQRLAAALTNVDATGVYVPPVVSFLHSWHETVGESVSFGAATAHALASSGIPLVIGSQLPLSEPAAIAATSTLYAGLVGGDQPLAVVNRVRDGVRQGGGSDWAKLVVYESLGNARLPAMTVRPLRVFVSYARKNERKVGQLYRRLRDEGFDPWLDLENIRVGQDWEREIGKALRSSDVVLVCLSTAVTKGGFVRKEIRQAVALATERAEDDVFVMPARLDDCKIPQNLAKYHCIPIEDEKGVGRLVSALHERARELRGERRARRRSAGKPARNALR